MPQDRRVAIVTGASRGAGRGIARALGSHGCIVYATGRSETEGQAEMPGTIHATTAEVTAAGGIGIAARCDHSDDAQIEALIERVISEHGRIDILVNNACARHMVNQDKGLIVFTSSPGAMHYCFGPAYGAHKAGVDFADADCNVAAVPVSMGSLATERLLSMMKTMPDRFAHLAGTLETPDYTGHVAWALYNDPEMMRFNGRTLIGAEVGREYGLTDSNGAYPPSVRQGTGASPASYAPYKVK